MFHNPLPPASGTTIIGIATGLGIASSVVLRHFGCSEEATFALSGAASAVWLVCHPQVNRSVPVSPEPAKGAVGVVEKH